MGELIDIKDLSAALGVSEKTIYRWVKQRRIPFIKLEHHLRFERDVVFNHFKEKTQNACPAPIISLDEHRRLRSLKISEKTALLSPQSKGQSNGDR